MSLPLFKLQDSAQVTHFPLTNAKPAVHVVDELGWQVPHPLPWVQVCRPPFAVLAMEQSFKSGTHSWPSSWLPE
jgi:hypothetical protein